MKEICMISERRIASCRGIRFYNLRYGVECATVPSIFGRCWVTFGHPSASHGIIATSRKIDFCLQTAVSSESWLQLVLTVCHRSCDSDMQTFCAVLAQLHLLATPLCASRPEPKWQRIIQVKTTNGMGEYQSSVVSNSCWTRYWIPRLCTAIQSTTA